MGPMIPQPVTEICFSGPTERPSAPREASPPVPEEEDEEPQGPIESALNEKYIPL